MREISKDVADTPWLPLVFVPLRGGHKVWLRYWGDWLIGLRAAWDLLALGAALGEPSAACLGCLEVTEMQPSDE